MSARGRELCDFSTYVYITRQCTWLAVNCRKPIAVSTCCRYGAFGLARELWHVAVVTFMVHVRICHSPPVDPLPLPHSATTVPSQSPQPLPPPPLCHCVLLVGYTAKLVWTPAPISLRDQFYCDTKGWRSDDTTVAHSPSIIVISRVPRCKPLKEGCTSSAYIEHTPPIHLVPRRMGSTISVSTNTAQHVPHCHAII